MITMVICVNITIRGINREVYKEVRSETVKRGVKIGEAVNEALSHWLEASRTKKAKRSLLDVRATNWGPGTEKTSTQVDEILYGWKK